MTASITDVIIPKEHESWIATEPFRSSGSEAEYLYHTHSSRYSFVTPAPPTTICNYNYSYYSHDDYNNNNEQRMSKPIKSQRKAVNNIIIIRINVIVSGFFSFTWRQIISPHKYKLKCSQLTVNICNNRHNNNNNNNSNKKATTTIDNNTQVK